MILDKVGFEIKNIKEFIEKNEKKFNDLKSLKYMNDVYSINDFVVVSFHNKLKNDFFKYYAKIKKIKFLHDKNDNIYLCFIKIQFYFEKEDLPKSFFKYLKDISINELFISELEEYINITNLESKFKLVSLEDYQKSVEDIDLKFTIAEFDINTNKIIPKLNQRNKICSCNKIENPDYDYIFCEGCKKWFHYFCVGLKNEQNISNLHFKCKTCR